jgi:hypothetical protein
MADSLVALTYRFTADLVERAPNGAEMERTGHMIPSEIERTIVVPKNLWEEMFEIDLKSQKRSHHTLTLVGEVERRDVSMNYPAPHYWSL